ncbi:MAG: SGNH/GDSL hydrolase family protein [Deltaproteobacteria bacterium]|nr:SGNH/GDSL hydrolase family protein [Deltaproteobacteria bacterium]
MRGLPLLGLLAVALVGCDEAPRTGPRAPTSAVGAPDGAVTPRYLALGDSFTIGTGGAPSASFPARLVERWRSRCVVRLENVAVNGFTTDDLIEKELPSLATFKPTFVTVAIGANDIVRGTSVDAYRANVRRILDAVAATGAKVVVVPQPDWSRSPVSASFGKTDALDASIRTFNEVLAAEARAHGATFVDLAPLMRDQAAKKMVASDGLHPNGEAYDAWAAELARVLPAPCGG